MSDEKSNMVGKKPIRVSGDGIVEESEITEEIWYWVRTLHFNGAQPKEIPILIEEKVPGTFITVATILDILR